MIKRLVRKQYDTANETIIKIKYWTETKFRPLGIIWFRHITVDYINKAWLWNAAAGDEQDPTGEWKCQGGSEGGSASSGGTGC